MQDQELMDFFNLKNDVINTTFMEDKNIMEPSQENNHDEHEIKTPNETAQKTGSVMEFIEYVQGICNKTMSDVTFKPDDDLPKILTPKNKIDGAFITFKVIKRRPVKELKPIMRNEFVERTVERNEERYGTVFFQRFECEIQFNIFASGYSLAEEVMNKFEEVMLEYAYIFLENGIQQCIFKEQKEDDRYEIYRQIASVRHLVYKIIYEKNSIAFQHTIQAVEANLKK